MKAINSICIKIFLSIRLILCIWVKTYSYSHGCYYVFVRFQAYITRILFLHALSFLATKLNIVKIIYLNTHFKRIPLNACVNDMIAVKMLAINTTMTYSYEVHLSFRLMEYDRKLAKCNIQTYELFVSFLILIDMKNNKMLDQNWNKYLFDAPM